MVGLWLGWGFDNILITFPINMCKTSIISLICRTVCYQLQLPAIFKGGAVAYVALEGGLWISVTNRQHSWKIGIGKNKLGLSCAKLS